LKLRPVKFRYKKPDASGQKPIQYGLIAEEVAEVYPELVVRDATTGRIDGVRYDELAPMLLNEMQQQHGKMTAQAEKMAAQATINAEQAERIAAQDEHIGAQAKEIRDLKQHVAELNDLKHQMAELKNLNQATQVALRKMQTRNEFVAQR
jgi:hypothetical protein